MTHIESFVVDVAFVVYKLWNKDDTSQVCDRWCKVEVLGYVIFSVLLFLIIIFIIFVECKIINQEGLFEFLCSDFSADYRGDLKFDVMLM